MYEFIFVYIVLSLIIIIKIIDFFVGNIFSMFFHVHLSILDKVVSSLYAIFGTACIWKIFNPNYDFLVPLCFYLVQKYEKNAVAKTHLSFATALLWH
jgi:hypothetical protein